MNQNKKKILLCWGYNRKGWISPFEALKNHYEFIYLYYRFAGEEEACFTDCARIYWYDFDSGFHILDHVQPDAVVFMSLTSGYPIALNAACKSRKVPTYIFQHGLFRTYKEYRAIERADLKARAIGNNKKNNDRNLADTLGKSTLRFLLASLSGKQLFSLPLILFYFLLLKKKGQYFASFHLPLDVRRPTNYICYTPRNATIYREIDKIGEKQIVYTGIPELDTFFVDNTSLCEENYYLLIDQAFAENRYYDFGVSIEEMNEFYGKLNDYCKARDCRLKVKLHPETYHSKWLLEDQNIDYIKDTDMVPLLKKAKGVFGTTSTLMLPAIYYKSCFLLLIHDSSFQKDMMDLGLARGADFYHFQASDIVFNSPVGNKKAKESFVYNYLFKTDGKSVERLKQILAEV